MGWTAYIDVETSSEVEVLARSAVAAGVEATDLLAVQTWVREHAADEALRPFGGRVICWGCAGSDDYDKVDADVDEKALLERLADEIWTATRIVAFNGLMFDFPFLRARALARGVDDLARKLWAGKPWGSHLVDPSQPDWCPRPPGPGGMKGWTLDGVADLLGIKRPPTLPGREVPRAWMEGRVAEIKAHCLDDVKTLRAVTRRLAAGRAA